MDETQYNDELLSSNEIEIIKQDDKRFKKGDLLKPAGYNAPARNYSRGNI